MEKNKNLNKGNTGQERSNSLIIEIIMLVIALLLLCFAGYKMLTEKNDTGKLEENNMQEQDNNQNEENIEQENEKYKAYDFNEVITNMEKNLYFEYEMTSETLPRELDINPMDENYHIVLTNDGVVTIKKENDEAITLSNVSNVKNINLLAPYSNLYILLENGDVYEYAFEDFENNNYTASKINEIENATKFVELYWADCNECGGNANLGIIDNNNKYIELFSVGY